MTKTPEERTDALRKRTQRFIDYLRSDKCSVEDVGVIGTASIMALLHICQAADNAIRRSIDEDKLGDIMTSTNFLVFRRAISLFLAQPEAKRCLKEAGGFSKEFYDLIEIPVEILITSGNTEINS